MEIKLIKDWKRRSKTFSKGTKLEVDRATGADLIKNKMATEIKPKIIYIKKHEDVGDTKQERKKKVHLMAEKKGINNK